VLGSGARQLVMFQRSTSAATEGPPQGRVRGVKGELGEPQGRDSSGGLLSGTAAPEALAGDASQPERGYNKVGAGGVPMAHLNAASGHPQVHVREMNSA
jgi:hypothetical protein